MQKQHSLIGRHRIYFSALIIITIVSCIFLLVKGKDATFFSLNSYHPFYLNVFFINYTFIGDGIFAICLIGIMYFYFKRKQQAFTLLYAFLISGTGAQIIKNLVNSPRPKIYFEAGTYLNFIDGVTLSGSSGFPSGHTATAFALATVMVLILKNKNWQLPVLFAAILVGYSRIYLAQHFLIDVIVGALLGTGSGVLAFYLAKNRLAIKKSFKKIHRVPSDSSGKAVNPAAIQTA